MKNFIKKNYKYFILSIVAILAINVCIITSQNYTNIIEAKKESKAYSYSGTIIDRAFIYNNEIILPFIFDNADETLSVDQINAEFQRAGLTVKTISDGDIATGTKVTVEENQNTYNLLIYGDVNGDGEIDLIDAQVIILYYKSETTLDGIYLKAADVDNIDNDGEIDLIDAQRIILFYKKDIDKLMSAEVEKTDVVSSISMASNPDKTTYVLGQTSVDVTGAKIRVEYQTGRMSEIDVTQNMIKNFDFSQEGQTTITVEYEGKQTTFSVNVIKRINLGDTEIRVNKNGQETIIPISFYNANGEKIDIEASNIRTTQNDSDDENTVYITLPEVNATFNLSTTSITEKSTGIEVSKKDKDGDNASNKTIVEKLAFNIITNVPEMQVDLADLNGKVVKMQFKGDTQVYELPIRVIE